MNTILSPVLAGIDVSAETLAVAIRRPGSNDVEQFTFRNDPAGHRDLLATLTRRGATARIVAEWTGIYTLDLAIALASSGKVEVCCVNPHTAHSFGQYRRVRAKTDKEDAIVLLAMAAQDDLQVWTPPSDTIMQLRAICRAIRGLVASCTIEKNRLSTVNATKTTPAAVRLAHERLIEVFKKEIKALEAEALALVEADAELAKALEVLTSVKGVAKRTACLLIAELSVLPESLTGKQVGAHAGLDPKIVESGTSVRGSRRISRRGNTGLRNAMYMPALTAIRSEPAVREAYTRMTERGKPRMVAIVAMMRRLLVVLWRMLKTSTPFDPDKFRPRAPKPT